MIGKIVKNSIRKIQIFDTRNFFIVQLPTIFIYTNKMLDLIAMKHTLYFIRAPYLSIVFVFGETSDGDDSLILIPSFWRVRNIAFS